MHGQAKTGCPKSAMHDLSVHGIADAPLPTVKGQWCTAANVQLKAPACHHLPTVATLSSAHTCACGRCTVSSCASPIDSTVSSRFRTPLNSPLTPTPPPCSDSPRPPATPSRHARPQRPPHAILSSCSILATTSASRSRASRSWARAVSTYCNSGEEWSDAERGQTVSIPHGQSATPTSTISSEPRANNTRALDA